MLPFGKNKILKKILFNVLFCIAQLYLLKERTYSYKDIEVKVLPGVFHPGLFFSTRILFKYIQNLNLKNKNVLELGAGSGMLSVFSAKQGAIVTATDITSKAVQNVSINAELNWVDIKVVQSDLFDEIPVQTFDVIIVNPPYFAKDPKSEKEFAWFCGRNFEFFNKLFRQLSGYSGLSTNIIMNLSEDCEIEVIKNIAFENNFLMNEINRERILGEWNYLFKIIQALSTFL